MLISGNLYSINHDVPCYETEGQYICFIESGTPWMFLEISRIDSLFIDPRYNHYTLNILYGDTKAVIFLVAKSEEHLETSVVHEFKATDDLGTDHSE